MSLLWFVFDMVTGQPSPRLRIAICSSCGLQFGSGGAPVLAQRPPLGAGETGAAAVSEGKVVVWGVVAMTNVHITTAQ